VFHDQSDQHERGFARIFRTSLNFFYTPDIRLSQAGNNFDLLFNPNKKMMKTAFKVRGLATISFYALDHDSAKKWYSELFGIEPYFNVPGYFEFRIGDYQQELGFIDAKYAPGAIPQSPAGEIAYWHVDDLKTSLDLLIQHGAKAHLPITDYSGGKGEFVTASVVDPFGNIFGIMTNKHYLSIFKEKHK
jgi:predicted enzyme related to lactoylglutathione lyase